MTSPPIEVQDSPESLAHSKRALNRGAEATGFRSAINAGLDLLAALYAARQVTRPLHMVSGVLKGVA